MKRNKRIYKYEVCGVSYYDGIEEGISDTFNSLTEAKNFIDNIKRPGLYAKYSNIIFKYEEIGSDYKYVKRIWKRDKHGNWYSTRHVSKYNYFLEI